MTVSMVSPRDVTSYTRPALFDRRLILVADG